MNGVWTILAVSNYTYEVSEMKTYIRLTKEEAEDKFYRVVKEFLEEEKQRCIEKYIVNNELSYSDLKEVANEEGDLVDYAYEYDENEKHFSIRIEEADGEDCEEVIVRMYYCDLEEGYSSQLFTLNDSSEDVDELLDILNKL